MQSSDSNPVLLVIHPGFIDYRTNIQAVVTRDGPESEFPGAIKIYVLGNPELALKEYSSEQNEEAKQVFLDAVLRIGEPGVKVIDWSKGEPRSEPPRRLKDNWMVGVNNLALVFSIRIKPPPGALNVSRRKTKKRAYALITNELHLNHDLGNWIYRWYQSELEQQSSDH